MFHYFYFNDILPFEKVREYYPEIRWSALKRCYEDWLVDIERRLNVFYTAQFVAHQDREQEGFDIEKHHEMLCQWRKHQQFLEENRERLITRSETLHQIVAELRGDIIGPDVLNDLIDAMWFNYLVDKYPRNIQQLRALPYGEYLKTDYWRYVRALMMLLYGARCQDPDDLIGDSYWLGWESSIHVHHLSYANRGNERFKDLTLLCERCHAKVHQVTP